MLDLKEECSVSQDQSFMADNFNNNNNNNINNTPSTTAASPVNEKRCTDCQTTTTPLWRGGPAGPKTLCNACGIKYHKKRRALFGIEKNKVDKTKKKNKASSSSSNNNNNVGIPLKIKLMASGIRQRENLEVEQAAMLLMALSYGSVYG